MVAYANTYSYLRFLDNPKSLRIFIKSTTGTHKLEISIDHIVFMHVHIYIYKYNLTYKKYNT